MAVRDLEFVIKSPGSPGGSQQDCQVWAGSDARSPGDPGLNVVSADRCDRSALVPTQPTGMECSVSSIDRSSLAPGDVVRITIEARFVGGDPSGHAEFRVPGVDGKPPRILWLAPGVGAQMEWIASADWPPEPGDVWATQHDISWFGVFSPPRGSVYLVCESGQGALLDPEWVASNHGPLRRVYRPGQPADEPRCSSCGEPERLLASGAVGHAGDEHGNDCCPPAPAAEDVDAVDPDLHNGVHPQPGESAGPVPDHVEVVPLGRAALVPLPDGPYTPGGDDGGESHG